ncbi:MAG: hypothetical protein ACO4AY_09240 [Ilumatobacteraceae bacterium]
MNDRRSIGCAFVAVAAFVVTFGGCSGSDDAVPPTVPATTVSTVAPVTVPPPPDRIDAYFGALGDPAVEPSTVAVGAAALYLEHRRQAGAVLGRTASVVPGSSDASVRVCTDGACAVVDVQALDPATGLVSDVLVDGRSVTGRIAGNGPLDATDGVGARVLTAYVTGEEHLVVSLVIENSAEVDVEVFPFAAVFRPAGSGAGIEASGTFGAARIAPAASSTLVLVFDTVELAGRIGLRGLLADGLDVSFDVEVPPAAS